MGLVIQNVSGSELDIDDLGFGLAINASVDLTTEADALAVTSSGNGGDLQVLINAGDIVVKDPIDNTTNLSITDGLLAIRTHNDTHYRMPVGGRIADAVDVDLSAAGTYLRYTGSSFVRATPAQVATELESEIDITNLDNYDPTANVDWTVDQSPLIINSANLPPTSSGTPTDQCAVTVGRTTDIAIPTTYGDLSWQATFLENDPTCIEHDNTNTDRILIKQTGLYLIAYSISFNADPGEEVITVRLRVNDTSVVSGSVRSASEDDEVNDLSNVFAAELTAGDFITLQSQASGGGNTIDATSTFTIIRASGTKGDPGTPGAGSTINVSDEGTLVTGGPYSVINFIGDNIAVTNGGGGIADVTVSDASGGSHDRQMASSGVLSSTTSTSFLDLNSMTLTSKDLGSTGTYLVSFSSQVSCNRNGIPVDFRLVVNGVPLTNSETSYVAGRNATTNLDYGTAAATWLISGVASGTTIKIQWKVAGYTGRVAERRLVIDGVPTSDVVT